MLGSVVRAALLFLLAATPVRAATAVDTCGQAVDGAGVLTADLDCSGHAGSAIELRGMLRLNGFTVTGNPAHDVVRCPSGRCAIRGPGSIRDGAIGIHSHGSVRVSEASIAFHASDGIRARKRVVLMNGVTVHDNGGVGVRTDGAVKVRDSDVVASGGDGIRAGRSIGLRDAELLSNGGHGAHSDRSVSGRTAVIRLNGLDGLRGRRVRLRGNATANGTSPTCGVSDTCADLAAATPPRLRGTFSRCDTSRDTVGGGSWGVCDLD